MDTNQKKKFILLAINEGYSIHEISGFLSQQKPLQPAPLAQPQEDIRLTSAQNVISSSNSYSELIKKYFPQSQWNNAYRVMMGESGGNSQAVGDNYPIRGEVRPSYGLFQIRTFPNRPSPQQLVNPEVNVAYAAQLWKSQGWRPWTVARNLGIK